MAARSAEVLVPGHGVPVIGAGRVRQALEDTAEWLETLERETVARMNAGATLEQILAEVRPPAHLVDRPYLQPVYDEPEFVVRNVWRLYGGWWDGVPRTSSRRRRRRWAASGRAGRRRRRAGGARESPRRGRGPRAGLAPRRLGRRRRADDRAAHAVRAEIYDARAKASPRS